jgi:PHD/YefM family antitoxin component YafN of YafNO toxin-antitoxin module
VLDPGRPPPQSADGSDQPPTRWPDRGRPLGALEPPGRALCKRITVAEDQTHEYVTAIIKVRTRTKNGRSYVVLISAEDLASLEATLEMLSDSEVMGRVRQAQSDIENGDFTTGEEMERVMRKRGRTVPRD